MADPDPAPDPAPSAPRPPEAGAAGATEAGRAILGPATLRRGDARALLAEVPDQSVDMILTDPPYNLGDYSTGNIRMSWRREFNNDVAAWDRGFDPAEWRDAFLRVLRPTGNLFAFTSYNTIGRWHEVFDPVFDTFQFMVWHKTNPPPKLYRAGFLNSCELIVCAWNRGHTWNFGRQAEMHNFIEAPLCQGRERSRDPRHPTQKPVRVLRRLVEIATAPGDLVCDPFMGVGSAGVAALDAGRRFLGFEIDGAYFDAARRRVAGAAAVLPWPVTPAESAAPPATAPDGARSTRRPRAARRPRSPRT